MKEEIKVKLFIKDAYIPLIIKDMPLYWKNWYGWEGVNCGKDYHIFLEDSSICLCGLRHYNQIINLETNNQ